MDVPDYLADDYLDGGGGEEASPSYHLQDLFMDIDEGPSPQGGQSDLGSAGGEAAADHGSSFPTHSRGRREGGPPTAGGLSDQGSVAGSQSGLSSLPAASSIGTGGQPGKYVLTSKSKRSSISQGAEYTAGLPRQGLLALTT